MSYYTAFRYGLLCHITRTLKTYGWKTIRNYDISSNIIMGLYIIYQTKFNIFIMYTIIHGCTVFILNYLYYEHNPLLHIICVQLPFAIGTYIY